MRINKYICDKCEIDIGHTNMTNMITFRLLNNTQTLDLCDKCYFELVRRLPELGISLHENMKFQQ